jgi:Growth-Arrest-Specific Protein 2 Domain
MFFLLFLQVRDLVEKCTCPSQFPMIRVSEGKYRIGDTKVLIFVRVSQKAIENLLISFMIYGKTVYGKVQLLVGLLYVALGAKDHRLNGKLMVCGKAKM